MEIDIAKNALIARRHIFLKTVRMSLQLRITVCALLESDYRDPTMEESAQVLLRYGNAMLAPFTDEQNNAFDCLERIAKRMLDDIEHKPNTTGVTGVEGGVDTTGVEGGVDTTGVTSVEEEEEEEEEEGVDTTGVTSVEEEEEEEEEEGVDTTGVTSVEEEEEEEGVHQTIGVKPVETYCVTRMNRMTFIMPTGVTGVEGGVDTTGVEGGEEVEVVHQTIGVKPVETYCVTRMNRVTFITPTSVVDATDMTTGVADVTDTTNDDTTEPSKE